MLELPGGNDDDILRAALERGDEFTFLTADLDHYRRHKTIRAQLDQAREWIEVNPFEYKTVELRVLEAHAKHGFDAVLCLLDTRLPEAARLAQRLGLRHVNPVSAALLRDKFQVRRRLAECGIAQPAFALATSNAALQTAVTRLGLPVLIKPADGYGSQNIVVLRHPEDLDPRLSPLEEMLPSRVDYGLGVKANDRLLVERYLGGTVLGCDTLTADGRHCLLGVHEKQFFAPPSFAIRGGCFQPNRLEFESIERYVFSVLDAVGFDWGAAHTELMITSAGLRLIEINPRLVGAKIPRLVGYALNRSLHADLIALHLGETTFPPAVQSDQIAVSRWITADRAGVLEHVELPALSDPHLRHVELLKKSGDSVRPPLENNDRIGYVMACGNDRVSVERSADDFVARCRCQIRVED